MSLSTNNKKGIEVLPESNSTFSAHAVKDLVFKYLHHLPFILLCIVLGFGVGYIYIRYAEPIYNADIQFLVKTPELSANSNKNQLSSDLVEEALNDNKKFAVEVEMTRIKSLKFIKRVVEKGNFQIKIRNLGRFRSSTLFYESPIQLKNLILKDSSVGFALYIDKVENNWVYFTKGKNQPGVPEKIQLHSKIVLPSGISFFLTGPTQKAPDFLYPLEISYTPSQIMARQLASRISVGQAGKTPVILVSLKSDNPIAAKEFLDLLVYEYQALDVESKRKAGQDAITFINDRLRQVSAEVNDLNDQLIEIKRRNKYFDIQESAAGRNRQIESIYFKKIEKSTEKEVVKMLRNYILDETNARRRVPTLFGLEDGFLVRALGEYNQLQLNFEQNREQFVGLDSNRFILDYEKRIKELRYNIVEILNNLYKKLEIDESLLQKSESYQENEVSKVPELQKEFDILMNQLSIKRALNTYLIQRKEQLAITSSSIQPSYELIDRAQASTIPVEPKVDNIRNFSLLAGLIIAILIIYLIELFNDKIISRDQLQKKLKLPIAGEIAHTDQADRFVFKKSRSLIAEQFRMVRANLPYLLKTEDTHKVILITSTIPGEGKSFISSNLAASLSLVNKKTALLLFDLRKINSVPAINELMEQTRLQRGITNYLIGQVENPDQIHLEHPDFPNLHVFPSGPIPPNPAELLLNPKVKELFDYLRSAYDYVIVDTAPSALVSDCFILQDYADITLYLIRQRYTLLKQMDYIREIAESGRLKNMTLLVNDVVAGGRYGYYGYTYTYGYGYTYNYNYTYQTKYVTNQYYTESIKLSWLNRLMGFTMKLLRKRK